MGRFVKANSNASSIVQHNVVQDRRNEDMLTAGKLLASTSISVTSTSTMDRHCTKPLWLDAKGSSKPVLLFFVVIAVTDVQVTVVLDGRPRL